MTSGLPIRYVTDFGERKLDGRCNAVTSCFEDCYLHAIMKVHYSIICRNGQSLSPEFLDFPLCLATPLHPALFTIPWFVWDNIHRSAPAIPRNEAREARAGSFWIPPPVTITFKTKTNVSVFRKILLITNHYSSAVTVSKSSRQSLSFYSWARWPGDVL